MVFFFLYTSELRGIAEDEYVNVTVYFSSLLPGKQCTSFNLFARNQCFRSFRCFVKELLKTVKILFVNIS